jgi:hypothetical protein
MKKVLSVVTSQQQSAFVSERLISDNILVTYEALHIMNTRRKGKKGYMVVKLDMNKAYDRVEWKFLKEIMRKIGFTDPWIALIMKCVASISYSMMVNGTPYGTITPTRGLRQRNPLSRYLFLLCAEGLSSLLANAENVGGISRVPISTRRPKISHLFSLPMIVSFFVERHFRSG